ncbi:ribosomal RNA small subunit methyltransferase G [Pseudoclavibacter endophyticus]|uniref:Ribosomal RNA small subunit methyltransferase G n=1 Tax=Pseudoclavibacter endophyticus TaxID=1778590 RepID=A0A6H9WQJ6_9MICO|nr:16S rRNA (guanine(527)-N(7))-methyltransferase RsmG [Pseudoclavibacter endophyticus]KAB1650428.1 16S rRNA (guanine(527)-N(7))-methyltransferase RsmG [Pseudoclavibacter endophyticus]GGA68582.1 ribosomal RNA small subunit methyltransferase G [Pseudoclavibacter endophyticus]
MSNHESSGAGKQPFAVEAEPPIAAQLFGDNIVQARRFAADLAEDGELRGLIGPSEYPRLWTRHIVNSVLLAPLLRESVADVGSGAGLPGIPLAIARPDVAFTLIEPMERRTTWLNDVVERLALKNVTILRARAEDVHDDVAVQQVTARAVSAMSKLIPLTAPLAVAGGELLLLKGRAAETEIDKASKVIRKYRLSEVRVEELGEGLDTEPTRVVRALVDAEVGASQDLTEDR